MALQEQETKEQNDSEITKTKHGIPIDYTYSRPASEERIKTATESLTRNSFVVHVVDSPQDARSLLEKLLPDDKTIFTASSETVRLSGIDQLINAPESRFKSLRQEIVKLDPATQFREQIKMGATPDVVVGSVHAITDDGRVLVGSASGSQLGPFSAGAEKVFWIVGSQKLVKDLDDGLRRLDLYSFPMEDSRMRDVRDRGSVLAKILISNREVFPGRTTIIIVREPIGF
jgi:hypothetical protein